ncbi:MAG TPA: DUF4340 domain-containing protein [Candidatus Acidoferrum sp.]|jgi:hypothetical protein|nr:DUF4340 domain-containing protein [Candidatus Acidoferrum sp.]
MNAKKTWVWICVAACLFALIYLVQRFPPRPPSAGPGRILPKFNPAAVTSVQVRPGGPVQLEIRAERTNDTWLLKLSEKMLYPAYSEKIESLLSALAQLTPDAYITPSEIRTRPKADEDYGFASPQASLTVHQGGDLVHLNIGVKTAPGDQVFLQVVGVEGAYVINADFLKLVPAAAADWRDITLIDLRELSFDRLAVTNNTKALVLVLQLDATNRLFRMVWPFPARADNSHIETCLQNLHDLRVRKFITDDPKPDLESFGLAPPALELALAQGTNTVAALQFGKSPTNDAGAVYARRPGQNTVVTVSKDLLAPWQRESVNDFRDPHLLTLTEPVRLITARALEPFSLQWETNGAWRIQPEGLPGDAGLVAGFLSVLTNAQIRQFVKDVVNPPELPDFGLAPPMRKYTLQAPGTNSSGALTNVVIAELDFGCVTNQPDRAFARRTDETSVYAVSTNDFARLPTNGWQLRERKLWDLSAADVARITIHQQDKVRQLVHNGPHQWSLAAGSAGNIEDLAVEETVRGLAQVSVLHWTARGETNRTAYGFGDKPYEITLELQNGTKHSIAFGNETGTGSVYSAVTLDGQLWIGEFPGNLYGQTQYSLSIP